MATPLSPTENTAPSEGGHRLLTEAGHEQLGALSEQWAQRVNQAAASAPPECHFADGHREEGLTAPVPATITAVVNGTEVPVCGPCKTWHDRFGGPYSVYAQPDTGHAADASPATLEEAKRIGENIATEHGFNANGLGYHWDATRQGTMTTWKLRDVYDWAKHTGISIEGPTPAAESGREKDARRAGTEHGWDHAHHAQAYGRPDEEWTIPPHFLPPALNGFGRESGGTGTAATERAYREGFAEGRKRHSENKNTDGTPRYSCAHNNA